MKKGKLNPKKLDSPVDFYKLFKSGLTACYVMTYDGHSTQIKKLFIEINIKKKILDYRDVDGNIFRPLDYKEIVILAHGKHCF